MADGKTITSVDLQRRYLELAQGYKGESEQTDWILNEWESILDGLEKDPMQLADRVDWVAKRQIVEQYMAEENVGWRDDALISVDLEYHNIDPEKSLFYAYQEMEKTTRVVDDVEVTTAMTDPPQDTRAKGRAKLVEQVLAKKSAKFYLFDWNGVALDRHTYIEMPDPFETYENIGK
jgi:proteasome accessory factor A